MALFATKNSILYSNLIIVVNKQGNSDYVEWFIAENSFDSFYDFAWYIFE